MAGDAGLRQDGRLMGKYRYRSFDAEEQDEDDENSEYEYGSPCNTSDPAEYYSHSSDWSDSSEGLSSLAELDKVVSNGTVFPTGQIDAEIVSPYAKDMPEESQDLIRSVVQIDDTAAREGADAA